MTEFVPSRRDTLRSLAVLGAVGAAVALNVSKVEAAQPHMNAALSDLQSALGQLQAAIPDKGGHRVRAIALVQQAIDQTTKGMAAGAM